MRRRTFLRSGLALPFLGRLRAQTTPLVDAGFHLHPHYRAETPLDATLLKTKAGLDDFVTEQYHDQIAAILAEWRANLVESIEKILAPDFLGASPQPAESRIVRPGPALEVRRVTFSPTTYSRTRRFHPGFAVVSQQLLDNPDRRISDHPNRRAVRAAASNPRAL